jgi:ATP-dependent 26S proteasome regulatory subunit
MIIDKDIPLEHRKHALANLCMDDSAASQKMVALLLEKAAQGSGETLHALEAKKLSEVRKAMESGPYRNATFIRMLDKPPHSYGGKNGDGKGESSNGEVHLGAVPRAHVKLEDGASAYCVVPEADLAKRLRTGDAVVIDAQSRTLMYLDSSMPQSGEEARLERRIDAQRIEVTLRDHERIVCLAAATLVGKLDAGEVEPGAWVLVCPRRNVAFDAVPHSDRLAHYQFLAKEPVPDVIVERDVGDPPEVLEDLAQHVRTELSEPERPRRYRLPRARSVLLYGVSGGGKTLCILAFWRLMYEILSEATGVPIDDLPYRVMRLRAANVLSKWYGDSEKLIDKFFDEVEQFSSEKVVGADGRLYEAPTLVIVEEADGLGRARGADGVHDRVQNTLLERMDLSRPNLRNRLIIFLFSTNLPRLADISFLRRASETSVSFGRLSKPGFCAVLDKHLRDLPVHQNGDGTQAAARSRLKNEVTSWLYSTNGEDKGVVEITFAGATQPEVRHRRDFLTGALVKRAVEDASKKACYGGCSGDGEDGLTAAHVITAFDRQIRALSDQFHAGNIDQHVNVPDGVRVANIRRIPQPALLSVETMR